ncbi:PREDICTED: epididymal secretory protein E3-beta-like [Chrysochloris asiatica]|uniref:Epididymal secretory protein E3-beta-like n=1 Tax=Chrysochloris asiatica TaxID=185453 RepID=A0A9B0WJS2_CHRAS|nr:PREDICTED: epididymal secretory protein E3-beta-like [Chrysochloris asiatica]
MFYIIREGIFSDFHICLFFFYPFIVLKVNSMQVILVTEMASSLKVLVPVLVLLCPLWGQLISGLKVSQEEFMRHHQLNVRKDFLQYKCDVLMKKIRGPKNKESHIFIYAPRQIIQNVCLRTWKERYRNVYIWLQRPFRVLTCKLKNSKANYIGRRSYSYIEFHCGLSGFVDSIHDMEVLQFSPY